MLCQLEKIFADNYNDILPGHHTCLVYNDNDFSVTIGNYSAQDFFYLTFGNHTSTYILPCVLTEKQASHLMDVYAECCAKESKDCALIMVAAMMAIDVMDADGNYINPKD